MEQWNGFGPKKVENVLAAIESSKAQPAHVLLAGLGIPAVGQHLARLLLEHCNGSLQVSAHRLIQWPRYPEAHLGCWMLC